jgi:predicted acetyltransferase
VTHDITIETAAPEDWDAIFRVVSDAFNEDVNEEVSAAERDFVEMDRALVARRDGSVVGTAAILTRQLAVPGGLVSAAHVSLVSVAPTARRQGVLTRFMRRQFADARAAGEPIAALWASEGRIYQRFGYGLATRRMGLTIETNETALSVPAKLHNLREGNARELRDAIVKFYESAYAGRPGWSERAERHWDYRLADLKEWRRGGTALRAVLHEGSGGIDGYALWRGQSRWGDTGASGEVRVIEHVATTPEAYAAIWRFLLSIDLTRTVNVWSCSPDEPLYYAVSEPRRLDARLGDALWVRVLDLPAALAARRYATDVDLVLDITDEMVPENTGRWRLRGSPTAATCSSTVDEPDLSCDIRGIGAVYLGGAGFTTLAGTGQVIEHRGGAMAEADTAFRWHVAPSSFEVF